MASAVWSARKRKQESTDTHGPSASTKSAKLGRYESTSSLLIAKSQSTEGEDDVVANSPAIPDHPRQLLSLIETLPTEVLTEILRYLCIREKQRIYLRAKQERHAKPSLRVLRLRLVGLRNTHPPLDILYTCKAFYFAGIEAYYGDHEFVFSSFAHLHEFLSATGSDRKQCIRMIRITDFFSLPREIHDEAWTFLPIWNADIDDLKSYVVSDEDQPALSTDLVWEMPKLEAVTVLVYAPRYELPRHNMKRRLAFEGNIETIVRSGWSKKLQCGEEVRCKVKVIIDESATKKRARDVGL